MISGRKEVNQSAQIWLLLEAKFGKNHKRLLASDAMSVLLLHFAKELGAITAKGVILKY